MGRESEAMPDTFVLVSLGEQQSKTKLVKESTNPAYDFKTTFNVNKSSPPYLNFEIFDYLNIAKDKSLGTLKLNIQDIFVRQPIVNQWIPLENLTPGEIRVSISFVDLHNMNSADSQVGSKTQVGKITHSENNLPTDILELEEENRKLQSHVPEDILANLPPDFREMLQTEVTKARQALLEEELEKHKKENINPECSGQDTTSTEIEEILDLVKDLDEETSKYIYEQLQIILVEIDQESKSNKIKDLKEELIHLQMEQTKIMPELPKDLLASLPTELSDEIQKSMKEAYLKMATEKMDETFLQSEALESQNKFEESKEKINSHISKSHQISTSNELLTTSIPEELLTSLPPDVAEALKINFAENIKILSSKDDKVTPKKSSDDADSEEDDYDDVTLPPTPAVQTPWSVVANQPARPSGPTPDSELREENKTGPFENINKAQTTIVVKEDRKISNSVAKKSLFRKEMEEVKETKILNSPEKDYGSVSSEIIEVAKSTVRKVIKEAKDQGPKVSPKIDSDILDVAQVTVTNIIKEAKTKIVESDNIMKGTSTIDHFNEIEVLKSRNIKHEDRFLSHHELSENNDDFDKTRTGTSSTVESAKQLSDTQNEKSSSNKQKQVEAMITEFLNSGDEDDHESNETEAVSVRMAICKKEETVNEKSKSIDDSPVQKVDEEEGVSNVVDKPIIKDNDINKTEAVSVEMAICKKEESVEEEEETKINPNDPALLQVAKETVSNVIDKAKKEVMKINQDIEIPDNLNTKKEEIPKKGAESVDDGAVGLRMLLTKDQSPQKDKIKKGKKQKKEIENLPISLESNKQKEVEAMITEFLNSDEENDAEIEPVEVKMAIYKKENDTQSHQETENITTFEEDINGTMSVRSALTKENIKNEDPNHVVNIGGHIKLKVLKAKNLKNTEMIGKSDPYVSIKYGNLISKSETKKNTLNPERNWEASFVLDDVHSDIILSIFDSDQFGKDDKMGSIIFEKQSLKKYVSKEPIWVNFTDNKPGQVLVFFDFNKEPEIEISKERKEEKKFNK